MITCYLGLGSNLSFPQRQLRQAIKNLRQLPSTSITQVANIYRSKAWGRKAQPSYCNTVIALKTRLKPQHLLIHCQKMEKKQGRVRKVPWGARKIDIDILLFGSHKLNTPHLKIPHPQMQQRDFVLVPLLEIATINNLDNDLISLLGKTQTCKTIL